MPSNYPADRDTLDYFITTLFSKADPETWIKLRAFYEEKDEPFRPDIWRAVKADDLSIVTTTAINIINFIGSQETKVVFCPPVVTFTDPAGSAAELAVANGLAILIDCDRDPVAARTRVEAVLGPATLVVASGGVWEGQDKVHCYWVLTQPTRTPEEHGLLKRTRTLGARLAVSDPTSAPLSHPIRWAGSWHRKVTPRLATIISKTDAELDLATAFALLKAAVGDTEEPRTPSATIANPADLAAALDIIPNTNLDWDEWNAVGMALWASTGGSPEGLVIWEGWSARSVKNDPDRTTARWHHYTSSPPTALGAGSIFYRAQQAAPGWRRPSDVAPEHSDEALTVRFVFEREADLRYTAHWNRWHHWTGSYWREDRTLVSLNLAREFCRRTAREANKGGKQLASARTVNAVASLARADQRIAAEVNQWDANPWLLGTPGGTIDLHRGVVLANGAVDYITRVAAVTPDGTCPTWLTALHEIANDRSEMVDYYQRIAGYLLTGSVREEKMFFLYGLGGNGKGTFIETLAYVLGAYSTTVAMSTLVMTQHSEHPTEIAKLCGTRLAVASETNEAARWNSARIKLLTGGDSLTGRFMRGDFFDFQPTHKLIVSSNRRPLLGRVDEAIARRTVMIPFERTFSVPDRTLKDRLRSEAPGILAWAVEGCLIWQRWGLHAPASVEAATVEYLHDQDDVQLFIDERCVEDSAARTSSTTLYNTWQDYCRTAGIHPGSKKDFTQRMMSKFSHKLVQNLTHFEGVRLINDSDVAPNPPDLDTDLFDAPL